MNPEREMGKISPVRKVPERLAGDILIRESEIARMLKDGKAYKSQVIAAGKIISTSVFEISKNESEDNLIYFVEGEFPKK